MVRERGSGKTPGRVSEILKNAVEAKSQLEVSKQTGIGQAAINRYIKGIGEPTTATLKKLADYFKVPVAWLQGHFGNMSYEKAREYKAVVDSGKKSGWVGDVYDPSKEYIWPEHYDTYAILLSQDEMIFNIALDSNLAFGPEVVKSFLSAAQGVYKMSEELQKNLNQEHLGVVKNLASQVLKKYSGYLSK